MLPKKSLGQHFLSNTSIVSLIADAGGVSSKDNVLEIGPGRGILTAELLSRGSTVIAVEKDRELIPFLQKKFKKELAEQRLILVNEDILGYMFHTQHSMPYKLVANIPYYITGAIIRKFLTAEHQPSKMALLVQKEVAERIIARDKKESLLSISVKAYGEPKYIKTVKAGSFTPPPKVDSAILLIDSISREFFKTPPLKARLNLAYVSEVKPRLPEKRFFEVLHAGFAHKRKQLFGNLRAVFDEKLLEEKLDQCGISKSARAEDLTANDWKCLSS
ncbi:MAG: ribosomal RNA small subunit methyltransferase A [Parcubacteria group bacterium]|nr:ribosomal RNA small subunit methyltransferase A [Parcubacteria group bacterium]